MPDLRTELDEAYEAYTEIQEKQAAEDFAGQSDEADAAANANREARNAYLDGVVACNKTKGIDSPRADGILHTDAPMEVCAGVVDLKQAGLVQDSERAGYAIRRIKQGAAATTDTALREPGLRIASMTPETASAADLQAAVTALADRCTALGMDTDKPLPAPGG